MNDSCDYKRLEQAHEAAGAHMMQKSPRADELIACLECEIAKRDARIAELHNDASYYAARNEELRAELAAIKAQEPVVLKTHGAWDGLDDLGELPDGTALYAAPVSEAKAQGVRLPPRMWEDQDAESPEYARGHNAALDYVARLNAANVRQASVPAGWKLVPVEPTESMLEAGYFTDHAANRGIYNAMLAAAPAAPAADAGLVEALEKLARLGNGDKYGNSDGNLIAQAALAAHRAKGVV